MATLKAVRGTRDLLPPETALWNRIEATARAVFARYNFGEIRTPVFEDTSLFARSVGEETDIVSKEMYTWEDRARAQSEKTQSLTLRPENTAGVVRAYIEHQLGETGQLQKLYYIGPQFRRERPQKGRYRQFSQIGAEVLGPTSAGSESPLRDAEILEMLATLLDELGIKGWTLELNSVGSSADRARYNDTLRAALVPVVGQMCADCQRRAVTNPLRVLDCKVPEDQPIIEKLPVIADSLDDASKAHFAAVLAALDAAGVPYKRNNRLVRGLDYYTRTTFEFTHTGLGAQNALLGGGRYDGLPDDLSPLWGRPLSLLAAAREHLSPRVRAVLAPPRLVVELDPSEARPDPLDPRPRTRLLIRYDPGAGIGWHRDRPQYGEVLGLSLSAPCVLRLRRRTERGFERRKIELPPRSLYLLSGEVRTEWEHSIVPIEVTRRSITLRTLR